MTPEVTLRDIYEAVNDLRVEVASRMEGFERDYRTCVTCNERHKVIDWLLKASLGAVVVETIGLLFLIVRLYISKGN